MNASIPIAAARRVRTEQAATAVGSNGCGIVPDPDARIETPTLRRVMAVLAIARELGDVVAIYGAQGVGKTCAALAYVESMRPAARGATGAPNPVAAVRVWYIAAHPAIASVVPFLKALCAVTSGGTPSGAMGAAELHEAAVWGVADRHGLLIVDEAQHLAPATLEQLRAIHDASGVGLALIGNRDLYSRLVGGKGTSDLDGLRARIGRRLNIEASTAEDAAEVADAWGITSQAGRRVLAEICASAGGLRSAVKALRLADLRARTEARTRTDADLQRAWGELGGA